ncbi:hypothetical protein GN956_G4739 [Arapaima gigas]
MWKRLEQEATVIQAAERQSRDMKTEHRTLEEGEGLITNRLHSLSQMSAQVRVQEAIHKAECNTAAPLPLCYREAPSDVLERPLPLPSQWRSAAYPLGLGPSQITGPGSSTSSAPAQTKEPGLGKRTLKARLPWDVSPMGHPDVHALQHSK